MNRSKGKSLATLEHQINEWNRNVPEGSSVKVVKDNGDEFFTVTRSQAWIVGGHSALVLLRGISGGYLLDRVTKV